MPTSRRVLITGASGLLGRALVNKFRLNSWEVTGLANSRAKDGLIKVDLLDREALQQVILKHQPSVIIHSAAERNCNTVDNEYEKAYKLNVEVSKQIAELAAEIGAVLIYISTDYVFDGTSPPYKETDTPNPLNKYGVTKLEGEKVTLQVHPGGCVLRVPLLYGQVEDLQESVVTGLLLNLLDVNAKCSISDYEIRYPTYVNDVAEACHRLSEASLKDEEARGIFQCSGRHRTTKYEMIKTIAEAFQLPMDHIVPDSHPTQGAPRPFDSHMDTSRLDAVIGDDMYSSFKDTIANCLVKFVPKH